MKILKDWKSFNEMNRSTYINAAKKFRELGHEDTAKKLEEHPKFLDDLKQSEIRKETLEKYKDIEPFSFKDKDLQFEGRFIGFEMGMSYDMWYDEDNTNLVIPCYFYMNEKGTDISDIFSPFWITKTSDKIIVIDGPMMVEEGPWGEKLEEGSSPVLFDNRRDANRFIALLKSGLIKDDIQKLKNIKEPKQFLKACDEVISQLNPKMLYK